MRAEAPEGRGFLFHLNTVCSAGTRGALITTVVIGGAMLLMTLWGVATSMGRADPGAMSAGVFIVAAWVVGCFVVALPVWIVGMGLLGLPVWRILAANGWTDRMTARLVGATLPAATVLAIALAALLAADWSLAAPVLFLAPVVAIAGACVGPWLRDRMMVSVRPAVFD